MIPLGRSAATLLLLCLLGPLAAGQGPAREDEKKQAKPKKDPRIKLAQPWPDAERLRERRQAAEALPLFRDAEPLPFTLAADFKALNRDRDKDSTRSFPGLLTVAADDGSPRAIPVKLSTRGKSRLVHNCGFVPIRVDFPDKGTKGTPFAQQEELKLGTHCHGSREFEQYALREYTAYRLLNLLTPRSFRARLARASYVDAKTGEAVAERYALFLEAESDLARRMEGRIAELPRAVFADLDPATLHRMMLFAYMIGNTDFSIFALHNVRLVQDQERLLYPVPYDFDYSGLVDAPYAVPARVLGLKTVQERAYRGPCLTIDELEPVAAGFREKKAELLALVESVPGLDAGSRRHMRRYLEEFFKAIADRGTLKHELVDGCSKKKGM